MRHDPDTVTASEIAEFVYCPEAWRLRQTGAPSANRAEHAAGTIHPQEKATAQQIAGGSIAIGRILIVDGLIALTVLWALSQ